MRVWQPVIWHDHWIQPEKCKDTVQGAKYVGKVSKDVRFYDAAFSQ